MSRFDSNASSVRKRARLGKVIAAAVLAFALVPFSVAWADEDDGISAGASSAPSPITVSTNQDGLNAGQVRVIVTGVNDSPYIVRNVDFSVSLPAGVRLVEGQTTAHVDEIAPWESFHMQAIITDAAVSVGGSGSNPKPLASTGDTNTNALLIGIALAMVAAGAVFVAWRRGRRWASSTLSILVVVALVAGLAPAFPSVAEAEELEEEVYQPVTCNAKTDFALNGQSYELSASMNIGYAGDTFVEAQLETKTYVAQGATSAHVTITSDQPLAAQIETSSIKLDYALADCKVVALERVSDNQFNMTIEGLASESGEDGSILLDERAFANPRTAGYGAIPVEKVVARLEDADASAGQGYRADLGAFVIPVSIGCAEFLSDADASAFSVPANQAISVTNVAYEVGGHEALMTLVVPGASLVEQFDTLDQALTEGGIFISSKAVNCGDITATAEDVERAEGKPYETTALEYVDASLFAYVRVTNATAPEGEGGPIELECAATLGVADVGAVDLRGVQPEDIVVRHTLPNQAEFTDPVVVTGANTFSFFVSLNEDAAQLLWNVIKDANMDNSLLDDLQESGDLLDYAISPCEVTIAGGGVTNAWGIPESDATALFSYDYDGTASYAPMENSENGIATAKVEEPDYETIEKSLQATNEALHAIGEFVNGFVGEKLSPGDLVSSLGSLFGFAGSVVGAVSKPTYTFEDVVDRLDTLESSIQDVSKKVDALGTKIDAIESRDAYRMQVRELQNYVTKLLTIYPKTTGDILKKIDLSNESSWDDLSDDDRKALETYASSLATAFNNAGLSITTCMDNLSDMIIGEGSIASTGICDLYYNYIGTYYNWEPETFASRKAFMTTVSTAYVYGYTATMSYLNIVIMQARKEGKEGVAQGHEVTLENLLEKTSKVMTILVGTLDSEGKVIKESSLQQRLKDRTDGRILNLVTGEALLKETVWWNGFNRSSLAESPSGLHEALSDQKIDKFHYVAKNTSITGAQFTEMLNRLRGNGLASSIAEELDQQGFVYGNRIVMNSDMNDMARKRWVSEGDQCYNYVLSVNPDRHTTCNILGQKHAYQYVGDVFDIRTKVDAKTVDSKIGVSQGKPLCDYYERFWFWEWDWGVSFTFYDYKVVNYDDWVQW